MPWLYIEPILSLAIENVAINLESMKQYVVHIAGNVYEYKIYDILS